MNQFIIWAIRNQLKMVAIGCKLVANQFQAFNELRIVAIGCKKVANML